VEVPVVEVRFKLQIRPSRPAVVRGVDRRPLAPL